MPVSLRPLVFACALALVPVLPVLAADGTALPKGVRAASCVEGICEYGLANGMRVLLFPDPSKPTVTVNVTYGVGSVHENYGETGMAHLLEHLVFKGTPTHADIPGEMKKRGISYNGTTSLDRTNYYGSFPANDATLDWLLALEADRMVNSHIAKKDLDSEMTVVRNEMERGENNPGRVFNQRLRSAAFHWHNYGNSTIGNRADVENVPIDNLQAFYSRWYQPDNATLIVAGRFDPAVVLRTVQQRFGSLPRPTRPLPVAWTAEPVQDGEREITVRRSGDMRLVGLLYHMPAATHPDTPALMVLANILGHSPGGRLHKALVEPKLAAAAFAGAGAQRNPGSFTFLAIPPKEQDDPAKIEAELLKQAEQIAATPVTAQELADARQRIANGYELAFNDVNQIGLAMSEYVAAGDWRLYFVLRDAMDKVSLADVNRVAGTYLIPSNRTLARFVPTDNPLRATIASGPAVATLVDGYSGREAVAAGEAFDPSIANIASRTEIVTIGDGLRVSLLPKKTRGRTVTVNADFRFGAVDSLTPVPHEAPGMVGSLLMRGSRTLTREQIDKRFEALKTDAQIGGSLQSAGIHLRTRRGELADALTLAADILRNPAFPQSEFEQLKLQQSTFLQTLRKEPNFIANQTIARRFDPWPKGHPLAHRDLDTWLADLQALTLQDVRDFHSRFYGTATGEIAIVGDFDPAEVKPLLQTLFAGWVSDQPHAPIDTAHFQVAAERLGIETPDKPNAMYAARINLPLNDDDPDYPALVVANYVFGSGMSSRLGQRVRQRDGLSYGIGSLLSADASRSGKDNAGSFAIEGTAAPQNMTKMEAAVREELDRFVREGITADELKDAVNGLLVQREQGRASDDTLASMLNSDQYMRRQMQRRAEFESKLQALSVDAVNAAIRSHIRPAELSVVVAGDFAGAGKAGAAASAAGTP